MTTNSAAEVRLHSGPQEARIELRGGRLVSYLVQGREVVAAEPESPDSTYRSSVLAPWPNRVAHGRWSWHGAEHVLPLNELPRGTALHGLVAFAPFEAVEVAGVQARLVHTLRPTEGYPFPLVVEVTYELTDEGLRSIVRATAIGDTSTPVGLGVHPYVLTPGPVDEVVLSLPAQRHVVVDDQWEELDRIEVHATSDDFRLGRAIGDRAIDACWTSLDHDSDGRVRCIVELGDGQHVEVWGGRTTRYLVVYTSDDFAGALRRRSIAVEPCTAPANALRSGIDLDILEPGQSLTLEWGLRPSWLSGEPAP